MRNILSLPAALLVLVASASALNDEADRHDELEILPTSKLRPEHGAVWERELEAQEKLLWQQPTGMRKMSTDEGEKFFLDYWDFAHSDDPYAGNGSIPLPPLPPLAPLAPHFSRSPAWSLHKRQQFGSCPSGYQSCTSINQPNSCCASDATCITVTDTGNGDVGCCPPGQNCGNTISGCDTSAGQTACPNSPNGGCCIAGYACFDVGCVVAGTSTVVTTLPVATLRTGQSSAATSAETSIVVAGGISVYTTTVTQLMTASASDVPDTTTLVSTTTITLTPSNSASATAAPPARPTTSTDATLSAAAISSTTTTTTTTSQAIISACPTGFYACSAYHLGGCCRTGRNCDTTSCPPLTTTTFIDGSGASGAGGVTVAAATPTGQGSCPGGFANCAAGDGGGCCPSGWSCGASCTPPAGAASSGAEQEPKVQAGGVGVVVWSWGLVVLGVVSGVGMVLL